MENNKFLVGNMMREVRNARLNCNNADNEQFKSGMKNKTYVKKIRKGGKTFPYASAQWQKKAIKEYARTQGHNISDVRASSSTEAESDGNPFKNYEEDIMGFMIAKNNEIDKEQYDELDKEGKSAWSKKGKTYKQNVTVKRRANLMLSTMQAIGNTRLVDEFSTRQTDSTPILYSKEVYAADMSSSFILDINNAGVFNASDNESAYRDYTTFDLIDLGLKEDEDEKVRIDKESKKKRIADTIKGLQLLQNRTTMTNNLEDLSAKFVIFGEYSIGNSIFNNILEENRIKIDYLKEAIEENEPYRLSKIYIGVRSEYFKQEVSEKHEEYLKEIVEKSFGEDDRFVLGAVNEVIEDYISKLEV